MNLEDSLAKTLVKEISFANDELIATSNAVAGFTGPIDLNCQVVIDREILNMKNFAFPLDKAENL